MKDNWSMATLIKEADHGIRRFQLDEAIHIVASEGNMRREAIDTWAATVREVVDSLHPDEPMFIIVDLSAPKQGFTPYSGTVSRELLKHVNETRNARSYIAMVLSDSFINMIITSFFQQILTYTEFLRQAFMKPDDAVEWMRQRVIEETRNIS